MPALRKRERRREMGRNHLPSGIEVHASFGHRRIGHGSGDFAAKDGPLRRDPNGDLIDAGTFHNAAPAATAWGQNLRDEAARQERYEAQERPDDRPLHTPIYCDSS
jgi:hypothetical protein